MHDAKLDLLSANLSGVGTTNGTGQLLGRNRVFRAWGRCGGDQTGAGATCSVAITESTSQGGTYTAVPGVAALAITEQVTINGTTPAPEVPSTVSPLPSVVFTTTKDWVRAEATLAGTSPVFPAVTVKIEPLPSATVGTGR